MATIHLSLAPTYSLRQQPPPPTPPFPPPSSHYQPFHSPHNIWGPLNKHTDCSAINNLNLLLLSTQIFPASIVFIVYFH